jgi:hypothetical protein
VEKSCHFSLFSVIIVSLQKSGKELPF